MVKKVIMNLDLSKVSGPDCVPVVVLKNFGPEFSYILAELFNMCLKESCFADCGKVSSVILVFKNAGERSSAKNHHPVVPDLRMLRKGLQLKTTTLLVFFLWLVKSLKNL